MAATPHVETASESTQSQDDASPYERAAKVNQAIPVSPDQRRSNALKSKRLAASFGEIISLLMRSPTHRKYALDAIEELVVPAVITGQFSIAEAHSKANGLVSPIAVVLWAHVSETVDNRISASIEQPIKLSPKEWKSGDIVWIVEAVGEPRVLEATMKQLATKQWAGKQVKLRAHSKDGRLAVGVLGTGTGKPKSN